ncbi:MAG: lmo0937 family membrane protein [Deltaproteobacteria bacterium]|nr:lmo0937 family membrane protein [Deltaproteobacteria bacterium]
MLWTIALILTLLWALGLVTSFTLGGWLHVLLVAALVVVVIRLFEGRPYGFRHGGHHPT